MTQPRAPGHHATSGDGLRWLVETMGLEPTTPCLQRMISSHVCQGSNEKSQVNGNIHDPPVTTNHHEFPLLGARLGHDLSGG